VVYRAELLDELPSFVDHFADQAVDRVIWGIRHPRRSIPVGRE
jgi:hypothetical protein